MVVVAAVAAVVGALVSFSSVNRTKAEKAKKWLRSWWKRGTSTKSGSSGKGSGGSSRGVGCGCGRDDSGNGGKIGSSSSSHVLLGRGGNHWAGAVKPPAKAVPQVLKVVAVAKAAVAVAAAAAVELVVAVAVMAAKMVAK